MDDAARDRLAGNIVVQLRNGVTEPVLQRALGYLRKVGQNLGDRVEKGVRGGQERCSGSPAGTFTGIVTTGRSARC